MEFFSNQRQLCFSFKLLGGLIAMIAAVPVQLLAAEGDSLAAETTGASENVIKLEEALERVREQNPLVLFSRERVQQALERIYRDRAALFPQLTVDAEQTRRRSERSFTGGSASAFRADTFDLKANVSVSLLNSQSYANWRLSQIAYAIEQRDFEAVIEDFLEQTAALYFRHLRDVERIRLNESNIERDKQLLQLARDQFDAGAATRIDITRAEVRIARGERALIQSKTVAEESILLLKALLDYEVDQPLELVNIWLEPGATIAPDFEALEAQRSLVFGRPEIDSAELVLDQARLARRAADWQRLPTISLFGNAGLEGQRAFDSDHGRGWLIGVRASIPVFEGFRIAAEKRQADAAVRASEYLLRDLNNQLMRDYRTTLNDVESRFSQIDIARKEIALAEDEVALARQRFQEGVADNRELIDAQQSLANAEDGLLEAIFLYGLSRVAFARAVGAVEGIVPR